MKVHWSVAVVGGVAGLVLGREAWCALTHHGMRARLYRQAAQRAAELQKPLFVVGNPSSGLGAMLLGPPHEDGSLLISEAPKPGAQAQLVGPLLAVLRRLPDKAAVVFVTEGLENVPDLPGVLFELDRVSGGELFVAHRNPATIASLLFDHHRIYSAPPEGVVVRYRRKARQLPRIVRGTVDVMREHEPRPDNVIDVPNEV